MAPPGPLANVERDTQRIIQTLFELLVRIHGFEGPDSTDIVANTIKDLITQFQRLSTTGATASHVTLPREVIQYVEDGRNPDIYTREFVELVVKQNQVMNGKRRAFARFQDVLAAQVAAGFPELAGEVVRVVAGTAGAGTAGVGMGEEESCVRGARVGPR